MGATVTRMDGKIRIPASGKKEAERIQLTLMKEWGPVKVLSTQHQNLEAALQTCSNSHSTEKLLCPNR